jgi:hypothetical protein
MEKKTGVEGIKKTGQFLLKQPGLQGIVGAVATLSVLLVICLLSKYNEVSNDLTKLIV